MKKSTTFKTILRIIGIIAIIAIIGFAITACDNSGDKGGDEWDGIFTNLEDVSNYLGSQEQNTSDSPYTIKINISTFPENFYDTFGNKDDYFGNRGRYVILDFSSSTFKKISSNSFSKKIEAQHFIYYINNKYIVGIILPDSVTIIEKSAFDSCTSLNSVTIGNGVEGITMATFRYCTSLNSVTIGRGVTYISSNAFFGCTSLASVNIPNNVTYIGTKAFYNCTSLTSITIGSGVNKIYESAFLGTSLTSVTIPNSVTSIGHSAFACDTLTSVTFQGMIPFENFGSDEFISGYGVIRNNSPFLGDLRELFFTGAVWGIGTYTRNALVNGNSVWTKQ